MATSLSADTPPVKAPRSVYIVGSSYKSQTATCFNAHPDQFTLTEDFDSADVYVFTGGEDIYPGIYGEKQLPVTHTNTKRDTEEITAYHAIAAGKAKVGICRGAQLLNALNGGKMWQDVNNHQGGRHVIHTKVKGLFKDDRFTSNSIHHQMMIPAFKGETLGVAYESDYRFKAGKEIRGTFFVDTEVVWYPEDRAFCFQAHPEFGHKETHDAFFTYLKHLEI